MVISSCECGEPIQSSHIEPGMEEHEGRCCDCFDRLVLAQDRDDYPIHVLLPRIRASRV